MPIPSKIVPPYAVSSRENESHSVYAGSQHSRTFSPPPDRKRLSAFPEHEHDISHLSGSLSAYNHASRPYASTSAHHRTSYYADSPSAPSRHHSGVSPTLENRRSHSHISISSDSHHTEATELLELRTENDQLKQKIRYLQGRVESITDAYTTLVGGLSETIDDTKDKVQKMVHHISTNFTGQIPGVEAPGIPLNPKQVDHKLLRYWNNEPWQAIWNRSKIKDSDSPILSLFFEDEFGQLVSNDTKNEIRGDLYSYWADMLSEGEMPGPYKHMGFKRKEDYRKTMEGKFPWLRLCEGHWKVKQIWTNHLNTWKRKHGNSNKSTPSNDPKQKTPGSNKPKHTTPIELPSSEGDALSNSDDPEHNTPIEIPSSDDRIPTGSKRAREDEGDSDAGSLKKHKGKEKAIATPGFHPTRPQPKKKITAKITTVDPFADIQIMSTVSETPPAQNTSAASGSGVIHPTPPLPSTSEITEPAPSTFENAVNTATTAPFTQIASIPTDLSDSPTPKHSPTQDPYRPHITPIITTPVPANRKRNRDDRNIDSAGDSNTASSDSPGPTGPPAKKPKGRFPFRRMCCEAWMKETGGNANQFSIYWKNLDDETKKAKIAAIMPATK